MINCRLQQRNVLCCAHAENKGITVDRRNANDLDRSVWSSMPSALQTAGSPPRGQAPRSPLGSLEVCDWMTKGGADQ